MKTYKIGFLFLVVMSLLVTGCNTPNVGENNLVNDDSMKQLSESIAQDKSTSANTSNKGIDFSKKHVRPAGEYITLKVGEYVVGRDFKPGRYYLYKETIDGSWLTELYFFSEEEKSYYYPYSGIKPEFDTPSVMFEDGQKIKVDDGSIILSKEFVPLEDFYEVERPDGTYVPIGVYTIGEDIPVGSYQIYPTSFEFSQCVIFVDREAYDNHKTNLNDVAYGSFSKDSYGQMVNLKEGSIFDVCGPIIMKKVNALNFD